MNDLPALRRTIRPGGGLIRTATPTPPATRRVPSGIGSLRHRHYCQRCGQRRQLCDCNTNPAVNDSRTEPPGAIETAVGGDPRRAGR